MEISIDVGKHVVDEMQNIAQSENKDFDVISSKILELGLRVYQSSKSEDNDKKHDPLLVNIFRKNAESNLLIKEIIGHRNMKSTEATIRSKYTKTSLSNI